MENNIKTFEDACATVGVDPTQLPDVSNIPERFQVSVVAGFKLMVVAEALNEDWQADYENTSQPKYEPWFEWSSSAGGFVCGVCVLWYTITLVGPRLVYKDYETAQYAGEQFIDLYNDWMKIPK